MVWQSPNQKSIFSKLEFDSLVTIFIKAFKIVETDASDVGYGGILKQQVHGQEHVIAYISKHWNPAQLKYSTIKKEFLAIVLCISKFQSDLLNQKFLRRKIQYKRKRGSTGSTRANNQKGNYNIFWVTYPDWESPKPTTTKQTVTDYAWSIQTLLDLEDIGLTKIPKLAKKTWAEMASESDDDSETDLQKQIQKAKQTKTVCNQRPSQSLTQQESTSQPNNNYISKNKFFNVLQMEPEYWDKNPFKATAKVFPPGFHYRPIATNKTRKFYEFILIDTNSVSIKHFKDPKDPNLNTHSTIQILKVMQPRHYGSNLNKPKKFSTPFDPAGYNYWDYIDAWTNVFWHQNSKFKHSWQIYFKNNTVYNFPNWFLQWWNYFGPIPHIFPEEVQQGFQQFNKLYNSKESRIPADLKYFSSFVLSWIFSWQYRYGKTENSKQYPPLQRHAFVKWWSQFDTSKTAPDQVKNWFQSNPEFLKPADPKTSLFLNQKSQLAAFLASSKSKESLAQNLKEVLQLLQQEVEEEPSKKEAESSETNDDQEDDPFYQNEDDCFGISLDED
uniref:Reverse transcriptase/retrotransposon-derived protein RNase H-like domain-containing protein n=1 Tax=Glycine max TaxID=3847 RepID=A0A0R0F1B8_SOYBN